VSRRVVVRFSHKLVVDIPDEGEVYTALINKNYVEVRDDGIDYFEIIGYDAGEGVETE
jgi:hypothetical protein